MKRNSDFMFEVKIEENLAQLHKHKLYPVPLKSVKKNKTKWFKKQKWEIFKRNIQMQQQRIQQNSQDTKTKAMFIKGKLPSKEELFDIITRTLMVGQISTFF